ncbi:GAF domain-containing protein [Thermosynechococcus sp. JY1334]|uniref:sensor histidine kinase n=1 Tax=unclassified Thermosynechococcus TaxID=2622553 RepID=UPI0026713DE3|nr:MULTISPECIES: GAF domain-containing protein [unclassified Thermosynechococcus]MDR7898803.1 GAF domain-containing protein [Thermosynechococcus sp. JY1332]MDR7906207.1 GAF domain-containing protein [Thermosynechococcus sp. JY1334]MDR7994028.1 GAF domain-containing protein [Thermosynechococcus sp. TG252]WKT85933.1 GAF domain-containing protein [Thermosynechococcus sp. JY1339]WNC54875.1 GAF domain-containing protein [Thermosynechococcus sp. JY1331]
MTPVIEQLQSLNRILVELARRQPFHGANFEEILQDILWTSARSLNVARVSLWFYSGDRQQIQCVQLFQQSPQAFTVGMTLTASHYPDYFAALEQERTITAHDAWHDPRTREFRKTYLEPLGITSLLDVPIWVEGSMIGILCHEHIGSPRQWTIAEEQFAASLADLVSLVVESRDRHRALRALEESEARLATFFQATSEAVIIHEQGTILDVNAATERLFGYTASELVGQSVLLLTHPEARSLILERIQQPIDVPFEALARTKSGEALIVEVQGKSILYRGRWARVVGIRDITQRKTAEQNVQLAAQRQQLLAEIALRIRQTLELPEILNTTVVEVRRYLLSDRVFIVSFDPRTEEIQVVAAAMAPQWHTNLEALLQNVHYRSRLLTTPATLSCEREMLDPHLRQVYAAHHIQSCLLIPIQHQPQGLCFLLGVHQCDRPRQWQPYERAFLEQLATQVAIALQQAELYQQLAALNANLEQQVAERTEQLQQKMRELEELNHLKDVFLHAVSHDLRTPVLGTLMVINHLLQNNTSDTIPVPRSTLTCIQHSQQRQLHLIETLLHIDVDQQPSLSLAIAPTSLATLVKEILVELQPLLQKNKATVKLDIPPTLPLVPVDPMQLRRVYENLITNALKHNRPGITITLTAEEQGDSLYCTVKDNGVGIRPDQRSHLFDLYYRGGANHHRTGIGLGLYLCREIIIAHGGEIGVKEGDAQGATFWFRIPLANPI